MFVNVHCSAVCGITYYIHALSDLGPSPSAGTRPHALTCLAAVDFAEHQQPGRSP
jgi:hypothetical protein